MSDTSQGLGEACRRATRPRGEDGVMLVVFALVLPVVLLVGAIVMDVGYWYVNAKRAQIAADACALAAAHELPQTYADLGHCQVVPGYDYILVNLPYQAPVDPEPEHLWTKLTSPYVGDPSMVEATVRIRVGTFLGKLVGVDHVELTRRAVAERLEGDTKMAIFTASTDCDSGLLFNGKNIDITGHVHSNGQYSVNSANPPDHFTATSGTIAKENCTAKLDPYPNGALYGAGPEFLPQDGAELAWPEWFTPGQFGWYLTEAPGAGRCTYKAETIEIDQSLLKISGRPDTPLQPNPSGPGTIVPTGTYCATKSFKINGDNHEGVITALSPEIQVAGNGQKYSPHAFDVLFFTVPNSDTDLNNDGPFVPGVFNPAHLPPYPPCMPSPAKITNLDGNNYTWAGIIFNPCGRVKINNQSSSVGSPQLVGTIYGFEVEINGDSFNMVGTEDASSMVSLALVE